MDIVSGTVLLNFLFTRLCFFLQWQCIVFVIRNKRHKCMPSSHLRVLSSGSESQVRRDAVSPLATWQPDLTSHLLCSTQRWLKMPFSSCFLILQRIILCSLWPGTWVAQWCRHRGGNLGRWGYLLCGPNSFFSFIHLRKRCLDWQACFLRKERIRDKRVLWRGLGST